MNQLEFYSDFPTRPEDSQRTGVLHGRSSEPSPSGFLPGAPTTWVTRSPRGQLGGPGDLRSLHLFLSEPGLHTHSDRVVPSTADSVVSRGLINTSKRER